MKDNKYYVEKYKKCIALFRHYSNDCIAVIKTEYPNKVITETKASLQPFTEIGKCKSVDYLTKWWESIKSFCDRIEERKV